MKEVSPGVLLDDSAEEVNPSLPQLQEWINEHLPNDQLIYSQAASDQMIWVRDRLASLFKIKGHDHRRGEELIIVPCSHTSKSALLPVYCGEFSRPIPVYGKTSVVMRGNFYDWKVTVRSGFELVLPTNQELFYNNEICPVHCEGFETEWVYPPYHPGTNSQNFTVEVGTQEQLWTLIWLIRQQIIAA